MFDLCLLLKLDDNIALLENLGIANFNTRYMQLNKNASFEY